MFVPFEGQLTDIDLPSLIRKCLSLKVPYYLNGVRSQLNPVAWLDILTSGSGVDPDFHYLLDGVVNGFRVLDRHFPPPGYMCRNYGSCYGVENQKKLAGIVSAEYEAGKLSQVSIVPKCIHALGTKKKKGSEKIRPITDCSRPDWSVNNCMEGVQQSFSYISVEHIVNIILEGKFTLASTLDLASAYRSVLISPEHRNYFGIHLNGSYYTDNCLCFGSKSAPFIFSRITDAVCRFLRDKGIVCYSYLDDVICLSRDYKSGVCDQLEIIRVFRNLGFYIAWPKVTSPASVCTYLGIVLDLANSELRLPDDRLCRLRKELQFWSGRRKATEKQLQVLIGHLCHCSRIIKGGNLYLHFLFKALRHAKDKRKIKLSNDFHQDLDWWRVCVDRFNSVPMYDSREMIHSLALVTDSVRVQTVREGVSYCVDFPCVYVLSSMGDHRIDICRSDDSVVGYLVHDSQHEDGQGIELFLPDNIIGDEVAIEVCTLWASIFQSDINNCGIYIICHRKATWKCLTKQRHVNDHVANILKQLFWWSVFNNVRLKFVYQKLGV